MKCSLKTHRKRSGLYTTLDGRFDIERERTTFGSRIWSVYENYENGSRVRLFIWETLNSARIELAYEIVLREIIHGPY